MCFETLLFDLDDTLYPSNTGIMDAIGARMVQYMIVKLGVPALKADEERERLFHLYGTTRRGLQAEYHIDEADFMDYVHDIPLDQYLSKNQILSQVLASLPQRKMILTNADSAHALRILNTLGIQDYFERIIDIHSIQPWCKPQKEAFIKALEVAEIIHPRKCVMIDDSHRNLVSAHELGVYTVQVGTLELVSPVDAVVENVEDLLRVLPHKN